MTMSASGLCADTTIPCENLTQCDSDNKTCSIPNTVCVNNTQCGLPVCFPMERASSQRCPPLNVSHSDSTTSKFSKYFIHSPYE